MVLEEKIKDNKKDKSIMAVEGEEIKEKDQKEKLNVKKHNIIVRNIAKKRSSQ